MSRLASNGGGSRDAANVDKAGMSLAASSELTSVVITRLQQKEHLLTVKLTYKH